MLFKYHQWQRVANTNICISKLYFFPKVCQRNELTSRGLYNPLKCHYGYSRIFSKSKESNFSFRFHIYLFCFQVIFFASSHFGFSKKSDGSMLEGRKIPMRWGERSQCYYYRVVFLLSSRFWKCSAIRRQVINIRSQEYTEQILKSAKWGEIVHEYSEHHNPKIWHIIVENLKIEVYFSVNGFPGYRPVAGWECG